VKLSSRTVLQTSKLGEFIKHMVHIEQVNDIIFNLEYYVKYHMH
jgi:hypothetical protein